MRDEVPVTKGRTFFMRSAPISVGVAVSVMLFILVYVVPKFEVMFKEMGALRELPMATQVLLEIANAAATYWYVLPGIVVVAIGVTAWIAQKRSREFLLNLLVVFGVGAAIVFLVAALFLPLIVDMEKIGK